MRAMRFWNTSGNATAMQTGARECRNIWNLEQTNPHNFALICIDVVQYFTVRSDVGYNEAN